MKTSRPLLYVPVIFLALAACGAPTDEDGDASDDNIEMDEGAAAAQPLSTTTTRKAQTPAIVKALQKATEGLLFMSESDYPFDVLYWRKPGGSPTAAKVALLAGEDPNLVEERTVDAFFDGAATPQDWQSADELAVVTRYQELVALLKSKLRKLKVYRFGRVQIHAYVVGVTSAGNWVALKTTQIET
ncbi:MAG: nuclease A inhibitor family protein [Deltaproteobacteria bacterium]|nr:nuclease A inhibitor family protein [Deltaproteobacteria bacterium]